MNWAMHWVGHRISDFIDDMVDGDSLDDIFTEVSKCKSTILDILEKSPPKKSENP